MAEIPDAQNIQISKPLAFYIAIIHEIYITRGHIGGPLTLLQMETVFRVVHNILAASAFAYTFLEYRTGLTHPEPNNQELNTVGTESQGNGADLDMGLSGGEKNSIRTEAKNAFNESWPAVEHNVIPFQALLLNAQGPCENGFEFYDPTLY